MSNNNKKKNLKDVVKNWIPTSRKPKKLKKVVDGNFSAGYLWLDTADLEHRAHIVSGNVIEEFVRELVSNADGVEMIDDDVIKNHKADILFKLRSELDLNVFMIVYREAKLNVTLDSEKRPANANKIDDIDSGLKVRYPNQKVNSGFLCPSWLNSVGDVEGLNDFITMLGYEALSYDEFVELGKELGAKVRTALV